WTGINLPLFLSLIAISSGSLLFWRRARVRAWQDGLAPGLTFNALYAGVMASMDQLAEWATELQQGRLRIYLLIMLVSVVALVLLLGGAPHYLATAPGNIRRG
ncbi:hypothetical protein DC030_15415, partial [Enterococcus faecalis]